MTFPSDTLRCFYFPSRENWTIFFCQPTTKSPYFAPGPAENQSQRALTSFLLKPETREKKINLRVVRDLRDFKMTTSDSYEPNHHTPAAGRGVPRRSSRNLRNVFVSIGEMANAPLLTAHRKKNFSFMCATNRRFAAAASSSFSASFTFTLSYRFQIATFFSKAKKFRQINLLTFSSKI